MSVLVTDVNGPTGLHTARTPSMDLQREHRKVISAFKDRPDSQGFHGDHLAEERLPSNSSDHEKPGNA